MTQHWRRSADGHIDAGGLDASTPPQGPGTESNRARAARGGWGSGDVLAIGPTPERPGDHESPTGPRCYCGLPPDGTGGHARGCPARRQGQGTETPTARQPAPAPGQVWLLPPGASGHPPGWVDLDGTVTIADSPATAVDGLYRLTRGGTATAEVLQRGQCIGVATPHGRVMVGDGFAARGEDEASVAAIGAGDSALLRARNGWEQWTNASGLTDGGSTLRRTRYAPARAGERYRWRKTGEVSVIEPGQRGPMGRNEDASTFAMGADGSLDPAQWERLDPGQPTAYEHAAATLRARDLTLSVGDDVMAVGAPPPADALTLQAPARDLRALFDAIGRALESNTPHSATVAGRVYLVKRDEMLFSPEVAPAADVLVVTADTKHLHALRRVVADALADPTGRAHATKWGKCHMVKAQRVGPALAASTVGAEPTRYQPSEGGANGWRWEVGE